ncbi:MAG: sigma 54-interacting transcriptional regulator [Nitrospirales bacterium]|nr:sigma 54-interacting transcriptional regulator [Nitrospirales bacterium]
MLHNGSDNFCILYDIALTVSKSLDLKTTLNDVLGKIISFMKVDAGIIFIIDEKTMELVPVISNNISEEIIRDIQKNMMKLGECVCGSVAQLDQEIVILEKASQDPRFTREPQRRAGIEFYAGLPLKSQGKVIGVLCVITLAPYKVDEDLLDIMRAATVPISLAIENSKVFESVKREAEEKLRHFGYEGILGVSPKMTKVIGLVKKVKDVTSSILVCGESGTGKELIARAIHFNSLRREKPFVAVNCAAIPENLLESELFGYMKGAFTGATIEKKGLLETADSGTIFLDEVDAMSRNLQAKLLRFLQSKTFFKVGGTTPVSVDVRIVAATNQDLEETVKSKDFREDLYYRLNVIKISLPPLKERAEDIPLLARYFINKFNKKLGKNVRKISNEAMGKMITYPWPGNIRELENAVERAVVVAEAGEITLDDVPTEIATPSCSSRKDLSLESVEKEHILHVLTLVGGSKKMASSLLGVDFSTLWRKLKKYEAAH